MTTGQHQPWTKLLDAAGGTVSDLAKFSTADGRELLFAATVVGVFCSTDGGEHWTLFGEATVPPMVLTLALSETAGRAEMFAGTAVGLFRSDLDQPDWQPLVAGCSVLAIGIAAHDSAAHPNLIVTEEFGLLRLDDESREWVDANAGLDYGDVIAVRISPNYATDRTILLATGMGMFRSRNGGKAWTALETPFSEIVGLEWLTGGDEFPVAAVGTYLEGLWTSSDLGRTWTLAMDEAWLEQIVATGPATLAVCSDTTLLSFDLVSGAAREVSELPDAATCVMEIGKASSWVVGGEGWGVARSLPAGNGWIPANHGLGALLRTSLAVLPGTPPVLAVLEEGQRIRISEDGGENWQEIPGHEDDEFTAIQLYQPTPRTHAVVATGWDGIYETRGRTGKWKRIFEPPDDADVVASHRLADGALLVLLSNGVVARTGSARPQRLEINGELSHGMFVTRPDSESIWLVTAVIADQPEVSVWYFSGEGGQWERWLHTEPLAMLAMDRAIDSAGNEFLVAGVMHELSLVRLVDGTLESRQIDLGDDVAVVTLAASPNYAADATIVVATNKGLLLVDTASGRVRPDAAGGPRATLELVANGMGRSAELYAIQRGGAIWRRENAYSD